MSEALSVTCDCGHFLEVTASHAGSEIPCVACEKSVHVPSLSKLRQSAGERDPFLSAWGRMCKAAFDRQPPFADHCQECVAAATVIQPLTISRVVERRLDGDGGISVNPLFVTISVAGGTTVMESATIPLLFCDRCYGEFRCWALWEATRLLILVPLAVAIGITAFLIAQILGLIVFVVLFSFLARGFSATRIGRRWEPRLARIPLVGDAVKQESELHFSMRRKIRVSEQ